MEKHKMLGRFKSALGRRSKEKAPTAAPTTSKVMGNASGERDFADTKNDVYGASDHWKMAYDRLSEAEQNTLSTLLPATPTQPHNSHSRTKEILNRVLETTEKQYEECQGSRITIRATAHKILNSALSFQDTVSNIVRFDPTGHASSAWAIVSLALTMAKNHADLRDALFDSSAYLADILTRCAFIEEQLYCERGPKIPNAEKDRSIVRVYVAILRYAAEVRRIQQFNIGKDVMESITAITSQPLIQLKSSINEEELHLQLWLLLDQHLHRKAEAEAILAHIDKLIMAIEDVGRAVAMLNLPFADGACFDSFRDQHENECLPGTRTELLRQVKNWGSSGGKCIFWLSGMAGTGKSTIARTVARLFKEDGILGASFFFKRGEGDRGSAVRFFPTVVKQLAVHIPGTIPGIRKAIENDPTISAKSLREQFDKLLLQPLLAVDLAQAATPTVIVIDALDECEREEDVEVILELLPRLQKVIRFFVTTRPDSAIRFSFDQIDQSDYQNTILQNLADDVIKQDITLYLREEFSKIRQKRRRDLPPGWPGEERIEALATMAVPLFIFAATVCRFVADRKFNPEKRLQEFLTEPSGSKMDKTYRPVLNQLLTEDESDMEQLVEEFQKIIGVIILLADPLSLCALADLLRIPEEDISNRLDSFHSVLSVPDDPHLPIRALHLSFHDYLVDNRTRAHEATSKFWVDKKEKHGLIASHCLTIMNWSLRKNICRLPSYGTSRDEIDPASIASFLPDALQYACRYWVYHLTQSTAPAANLEQVHLFLKKHFLHWLESMSILGIISEAVDAVTALLELLITTTNNAVSLLLSDAKRFILKNAHIAERAPLQLYCSGLIFAPQQALTRKMFMEDIPHWISRLPSVEENWSPELQTLEGHSRWVNCVGFSPDGKIIASASVDRTIKLWSTTGALQRTLDDHRDSGNLQHSLKGHDDSVDSVAISPDSNLVVSGSADRTVKLWNTTGTLRHTIIGHEGEVKSVTFSPDGNFIVSTSGDGAAKVWDIAGALQHTLGGRSNGINSVAFSPNGTLSATGSSDGTVSIWQTDNWVLHCTLDGHASVTSLAFSPDGKQLVSGSYSNGAKVWQLNTRTLQSTLKGHSAMINCVVFSPGGELIASGSGDSTVKIWDATIVNSECNQDAHTDVVKRVEFSPNGKQVASHSLDNTIRLWDGDTRRLQHILPHNETGINALLYSPDSTLLLFIATNNLYSRAKLIFSPSSKLVATYSAFPYPQTKGEEDEEGRKTLANWRGDRNIVILNATTGAIQSVIRGHSDLARTVNFSPDERFVVSTSTDRTLKLWRTATGGLEHCLQDSRFVTAVAFSPDTETLASSSRDNTIKLWATASGTVQYTLPGAEGVDDLSFLEDGKYLTTNLGSIDIKASKAKGACVLHREVVSVENGEWVYLKDEKALWLPHEYRGAIAVRSGRVVIGHATGALTFMDFVCNPAKAPCVSSTESSDDGYD
ncbi:uncharacterized protein BDV17DRAFT_298409 [Aspergillus undulatus]|uniref:uncharacterized protein n=1 Tax=Aspergillus undulatus TaxID=1810928 RepID=UPI003CCE0027